MGMRQIDMIGMIGKTQDAAQAQQSSVRAHSVQQDLIAIQQAARAEHASEQVSAAAPEDRLELRTESEGGSGGGGLDRNFEQDKDERDETEPARSEHQIDFLA